MPVPDPDSATRAVQFAIAESAYANIYAMFAGLRRTGLGRLDAALLTMSYVVINGLTAEMRTPPAHGLS